MGVHVMPCPHMISFTVYKTLNETEFVISHYVILTRAKLLSSLCTTDVSTSEENKERTPFPIIVYPCVISISFVPF